MLRVQGTEPASPRKDAAALSAALAAARKQHAEAASALAAQQQANKGLQARACNALHCPADSMTSNA
jgi:hypothetical protein